MHSMQPVHESQCSELRSSDETKYITVGLLPVCKVDARSGGQTGEWALVQEEQMGPLLTPGKISLSR